MYALSNTADNICIMKGSFHLDWTGYRKSHEHEFRNVSQLFRGGSKEECLNNWQSSQDCEVYWVGCYCLDWTLARAPASILTTTAVGFLMANKIQTLSFTCNTKNGIFCFLSNDVADYTDLKMKTPR